MFPKAQTRCREITEDAIRFIDYVRKNAIKDFEKEGISLYFPRIGIRFYAVPIINTCPSLKYHETINRSNIN